MGADYAFSSDAFVKNDGLGLLEFSTYGEFQAVYKSLEKIAGDSIANANALAFLGFNIDVINGDGDSFYPEIPILAKFEAQFQFESYRKKEEMAFFNFLQSGGDPRAFPNSIVQDPVLQTLLNQHLEIKIGDKIFKFLDNTNVAVVCNADYSKLPGLRGKKIQEIDRNQENLFLISRWSLEDEKRIFSDSLKTTIRGNECDADFNIQVVEVNNDGSLRLSLKSTSLAPSFPTPTYSWTVVGANGFSFQSAGVGVVQTFLNVPSQNLPLNVTLTLSSNDCNSTESKTFGADSMCDADFFTQDDITPSGFNAIPVSLTSSTFPNGTKFFWQVKTSDGTLLDEQVTMIEEELGTVTFDLPHVKDLNIIITLTVVTPSGCTVTIVKSIRVGCGFHNGKRSADDDQTVSGDKWRMEGVIWLENNIFVHNIGSSTKTFRKRGIWWRKKADFVAVTMEGEIIDAALCTGQLGNNDECFRCQIVNVPFFEETETNSGYVARNPLKDGFISLFGRPRAWDLKLFSNHKAKIKGVEFKAEKLFLPAS